MWLIKSPAHIQNDSIIERYFICEKEWLELKSDFLQIKFEAGRQSFFLAVVLESSLSVSPSNSRKIMPYTLISVFEDGILRYRIILLNN